MLTTTSLPNQVPDEQRIWIPIALQTANDPDMGSFSGVDEDYPGNEQNFNI